MRLGPLLALALGATLVTLVLATASGSPVLGWTAIVLFVASVGLSVAWLLRRRSFRL